MSCTRHQEELYAWLDGELAAEAARAFVDHFAVCDVCGAAVNREQALRVALRSLPVPEPGPQHLGAILGRARALAAARSHRRTIVRASVGSALAAGLAMFLVTTLWWQKPATNEAVTIVTMTVREMRTVNLVFAAEMALDGVALTVALPEGVEVEGYAGARELSWSTRLKAGNNVLALPLVAVGPGGGELVAELRVGDERKSFVVNIDVS